MIPKRKPNNRYQKPEAAHRINEYITDTYTVRIAGEDIESRIVSIREAKSIAYEKGLDLVEISPTANPPVCKVMDYQKFLYEQKKKDKENKANSNKTQLKEIRLTPNTDTNDFNTKVKHCIGFLSEGNKVKVSVFFKGRTIMYKEQGELQLLNFAKAIEEYGKLEQMPKLEGKRMGMMIAPTKSKLNINQ